MLAPQGPGIAPTPAPTPPPSRLADGEPLVHPLVQRASHPCLDSEDSTPFRYARIKASSTEVMPAGTAGGDDETFILEGWSDGTRFCNKLVRDLFRTDASLCSRGNRPYCSFDGHFQPPTGVEPASDNGTPDDPTDDRDVAVWYPADRELYAFSYFYDRLVTAKLIDPIETASGSATEQRVSVARLAQFIEDAHTNSTVFDNASNPYFQFDMMYIHHLWSTGYNLQPRDRPITIAKRIDGKETGWCLGSVLQEMFGTKQADTK